MIPTIHTPRLILDAFTMADTAQVELLAGEYQVARFTLNIPHPYPTGAATEWINRHATEYADGDGVAFAVRLHNLQVIGAVGLRVERDHDRAELGYWIGQPYWGQGYATEAARACLGFGFTHFALNKIAACYVRDNPASGKVMEKLGMKREGELVRHTKRDGLYHDLVTYGLLRETFEAST